MIFHVGQKVVCVNAARAKWCASGASLVQGAIYTITGIFDAEDGDGLALGLLEIENEGPDWFGYDPDRFRPIVENKPSVSFTIGADPESERWDNRVKIPAKT